MTDQERSPEPMAQPLAAPAEAVRVPRRVRAASWLGIIGTSGFGGTLMSKAEYPGYAVPIPNLYLAAGLLLSVLCIGYADARMNQDSN